MQHSIVVALLLLLGALVGLAKAEDPPYPFTRELKYVPSDLMTGKDVYVLQHLINRWYKKPSVPITSIYDSATASAVVSWKVSKSLGNSSHFELATAPIFFEEFRYDSWKDNGVKASDYGLKFKVYIPVHKNRSIEVMAKLFDGDNNLLHTYPIRARAHDTPAEEQWPHWNSETFGLNEFTTNGFTPSGLSLVDLNTPEPADVVDLYGKWNVLRVVRGLEGNSEITTPHVRNGILHHTGNWAKYGWKESDPMPNSSGCLHVHPEDQEKVVAILASIGVTANENPFGKLPYPYSPQGLLSIEVVP